MRYIEWCDRELTYLFCLTFPKTMSVASLYLFHHAIIFEYSLMDLFSGIYGNIKFPAQAAHRLYMVGMVVGDENISDTGYGDAVIPERLFQASHSNACVDKYSIFICV